jgi:hypothetical protein
MRIAASAAAEGVAGQREGDDGHQGAREHGGRRGGGGGRYRVTVRDSIEAAAAAAAAGAAARVEAKVRWYRLTLSNPR